MIKGSFQSSSFLIGLTLVAVLAGCSGSTVPERRRAGAGSGLLERTCPENVLHNLRILYGSIDDAVRDSADAHYWAERYRELIHPDTSVFKFYFVPDDIPPYCPEGWWGVNDEVASFENLLTASASGYITDILLDWTLNPSEVDNRTDPDTGEFLHPEWRWVHVSSILLDVAFPNGLIKRVSGGLAEFYFSPDPAASTLWVLTEWIDGGVAYIGASAPGPAFRYVLNSSGTLDVSAEVAVEPTTWGRIKGLFR